MLLISLGCLACDVEVVLTFGSARHSRRYVVVEIADYSNPVPIDSNAACVQICVAFDCYNQLYSIWWAYETSQELASRKKGNNGLKIIINQGNSKVLSTLGFPIRTNIAFYHTAHSFA